MTKELEATFGSDVVRLPSTSRIYSDAVAPLGEIRYRKTTRRRMPSQNGPRLDALYVDGRPAVLLSREDLTGGLLGLRSALIDGYDPGEGDDPGSAYRLVRNIVLWASEPARAAAAKTGE
jgi:hypothetical protein